MGKGSGRVCERAPMVLGGGLATAETPMLDPTLEWRGRMETWMDECDMDLLEAELAANTSFIERVVIARRIRELRGFPASGEYAFEAQPDEDSLRRELLAHPLQGRALFVEGSSFTDGLLYASMVEGEATRTVTKYTPGSYLNSSANGMSGWPSVLRPGSPNGPDLDPHFEKEWRMRLGQWSRAKITCKANELAEADVRNAIKRRRSTASDGFKEHLTDERLEALVEYIWHRRSVGTHAVEQVADPHGKRGAFHLYADVSVPDEHELIEHLVSAGAKVTDNPFAVPNYMSWANIDPGKRFSLPLPDGGTLHYVPHHSVGKQKITTHRHSVTVPPLSAVEIKKGLEAVDKRFDRHKATLETMLVAEYEYHNEPHRNGPRVEFPDREKFGDAMREMARTGEERVRSVGHPKYERTMRVREATVEEMEQFSDYMVPQSDGTYLYYKYATRRERERKELMQAAKHKPITVSWTSSDPTPPHPDTNPIGWQNYLAEVQRDPAAAGQLARMKDPSIADAWSHAHNETVTFKTIPHGAPMSERGTLRVEGTDPERFMTYLQSQGMARGYTPLVPYRLVYPGDLRRGRVIPRHNEYASGAEMLRVPDDHCVIHGMTGVQNPTQAVNRLKMIHQYGGLKSIAERGRMGIGRVSMSPKGDIASGIDHGVPTKIGNAPSYGSNVYFLMRPDVLERRDCWFSDKDFGGGHNRYDSYNQYAESIGQGKMHDPASHKARQRHLKHGLGTHNEAYLKHEISWDDIAVLCVDAQSRPEVETLVKKWKADGSVPKSLRVESFNGVLTPAVLAPIAARINKAYRAARTK